MCNGFSKGFYRCLSIGEAGEAEPSENSHQGQAADGDLMDGEAEGDTVVIAGQPEVLSTQAMQVCSSLSYGLDLFNSGSSW